MTYAPGGIAFQIISDRDWVILVNKFHLRKEFPSRPLGRHCTCFSLFHGRVLGGALPHLFPSINFSHLTETPQDKNSAVSNPNCPETSNLAPSKSQKKMPDKKSRTQAQGQRGGADGTATAVTSIASVYFSYLQNSFRFMEKFLRIVLDL